MGNGLTIVDTDIHPVYDAKRIVEFLAEPWRTRFVRGGRGPGHLGYWNPHGVMRADAVTEDGARIEGDPRLLGKYFLDHYHIDYGLLNSADSLGYGVSPDLDFAAAVLAATNDVVAADWLPVDERLRASILVAPTDPAQAAREIHRLGDHPGFVQVLMTGATQFPLGHRFYHPIYEAAVAHNLPVALHPGYEGTGVAGGPTAVGYAATYFEWHTGLVATYIAHVISLVTEGVFIKYPSLKFVLIEGGVSWLPPILWRLDKNWKALRMTTPWLERLPSEIVSEHILLTTQPLEEPENPKHLKMIFEMFDVGSMLMFSSDFPHWDGDTPDFVGRVFPTDVRARVLGKTACELYGLKEVNG